MFNLNDKSIHAFGLLTGCQNKYIEIFQKKNMSLAL